MRRLACATLLAIALSACATGQKTGLAAASATAPSASTPAPSALGDLVKAIHIPYESFTLANGLTVLVHTDRKAPIVGVTTYYRVGSKNEPKGRTGFAHLFEHLMFGGSENVENFDIPLEAAGSTTTNGTTSYDRTNYVETVPTGALDLALFMESDRMGHLLGAVTQDKLDKQRGVVQNEKRQGDNEPYGLSDYAMFDALFPVGHPYRHAVIGSMADLNAASLTDVRRWFADNYGPNNVVLALAGDIDAATARPKVEKWFGHIPRGPDVRQVVGGPVTLPTPVSREMTDQVPLVRVIRAWSGPGINNADAAALDLGLKVLGGLASSRLDNELVRGKQIAVSVSAQIWQLEQTSALFVQMDVKPGVDRAAAEAELNRVIASFLAAGPSEDELLRAATSVLASQIHALEQVGDLSGKGALLAEGQLYSGDPLQVKKDLARIAALTPADVQAAVQHWLGRPVFSLAIVPGPRTEQGDTMGGWGDEANGPPPKPEAKEAPPKPVVGPKRSFPPVDPVGDLVFPAVERSTLLNGIPVTLARRSAVPTVIVSLNFDAGTSADRLDTPGTQTLMLGLLGEGTPDLDATQIAEAQERLGARLSARAGVDSSAVTLSALGANLAPSLRLLADIVRRPAFRDGDVARARDQQLAGLAQTLASPRGLALRAIGPQLFGSEHPYGLPSDGLGEAETVAALDAAALRKAHARWLRPDTLRITVVGDIAMAQLQPMLDAAFGDWQVPLAPRPVKNLTIAIPPPASRIVLIDRPGSAQSAIAAGRVLPITGRDPDKEALQLANEVLGEGFLSRLNLNLREEKGWSYGVSTWITSPLGPRSIMLYTSVETARSGDSIREILNEMAAFPARRGVDPAELGRITDGNIRGLPNRYETNAQVLSALVLNDRLGRSDDYFATLPSRLRRVDAAAINAAAKTWLGPDGLVFVVIGDRKQVEPQLQALGLPIEIAHPVDSSPAKSE